MGWGSVDPLVPDIEKVDLESLNEAPFVTLLEWVAYVINCCLKNLVASTTPDDQLELISPPHKTTSALRHRMQSVTQQKRVSFPHQRSRELRRGVSRRQPACRRGGHRWALPRVLERRRSSTLPVCPVPSPEAAGEALTIWSRL